MRENIAIDDIFELSASVKVRVIWDAITKNSIGLPFNYNSSSRGELHIDISKILEANIREISEVPDLMYRWRLLSEKKIT